MKHLRKLNFVVLPLAIWAITVIYVLLNKFIGTFTQNMEPSPVILTILVLIFNLGLQLLIICASTIYAVKKLDLTLKRVVISLRFCTCCLDCFPRRQYTCLFLQINGVSFLYNILQCHLGNRPFS